MTYVPLHVHSDYSLVDGISSTKEIVQRAMDLNSPACALTDHGSVSGAVEFSEVAHDSGIKPILGCELYVYNKDVKSALHQVVLAKNETGWHELIQLVSASNQKENFYRTPRIPIKKLLQAGANGNLIIISGHLGSILSGVVEKAGWDINAGLRTAEILRDVFKENFFVEIQLITNPDDWRVQQNADMMREIGKKLGIECVATPDAHYPTRKDAIFQRILLCNMAKQTIAEAEYSARAGEQNMVAAAFRTDGLHIPSYNEMKKLHTDDELANTLLIADMCDEYSILNPPAAPAFPCPDGLTEAQYLRKLCEEACPDDPKYRDRVQHELQIFESVGLSGYFLVIKDILDFVRSQGNLVGVGRGSASGCLVSYLIGITQVDPLQYGLLFERFYNAGRNAPGKISWPDIDFDVPRDARDSVIEYLKIKYGDSSVGQIITFQSLKGRAALTKVFSAFGLPFEEQKLITKRLIAEHKITDELEDIEKQYGIKSSIIWGLLNTPDKFSRWCVMDDNGDLSGDLADMFRLAIRLEGKRVSSGKHAAGIIVARGKISDKCPMVLDRDQKRYIAGFDGPSCEKVGLLKLDCLGLAALDKLMCIKELVHAKKS